RGAIGRVDSSVPANFLLARRQQYVGTPAGRVKEIAIVVISTGMNPKRVARLIILNRAHRPSTDDVTGYSRLEPVTTLPKGEIVDPGQFEVLRMVECGNGFLSATVEEVLGVNVIVPDSRVSGGQCLREGIGSQETQSYRGALGDLDLQGVVIGISVIEALI